MEDDDAKARAGSAALARSRGETLGTAAEQGKGANNDGDGKATSRENDVVKPAPPRPPPPYLVLPDEVVMRILRFTLEPPASPCVDVNGNGATGGEANKWSVGGRFRMKPRKKRASNAGHNNGSGSGNIAPPVAAPAAVPVARAPLREVCRQWRRILDATCTHLVGGAVQVESS
jgi:hypothetical protein